MTIDDASLAAELDDLAAQHTFSSVITIDVGNRHVLSQAHRFTHRALSVPTTLTTRFAIASGSKAFTALAVMRPVEDGVLTSSDHVRATLCRSACCAGCAHRWLTGSSCT